jgi:CubicO group peptidase (beta-lactamase class C family)
MKMFFLAIFIVSFTGLNSQKPGDRTTKLDSLFNSWYEKGEWNGNVLIAEKGSIIYQKSFGFADWKSGSKLNNQSVFELASVSKQFTAMGIMILVNEGKLSFDDSLRRFFPHLPYSRVTIRHLLHHTGGLPDYMDLFGKHWDTAKIATNDDVIALMAKYKPAILFTPGKQWMYSNTGYALLASVIEKVSGKSFGDFLDKKIFKPLKMDRTSVYSRRKEGRKIDNYAYGHVYDPVSKSYVLPDNDPRFASMVITLDGIHGDGCVNSTTGDLFKWHEALKTDKLIPRSLTEEAFTAGTAESGKTNYGYGWAVGNSKTYGRIANHSGGWPGYSTLIERLLDDDRLIIMLQNNGRPLPPVIKVRMILYDIAEQPAVEQSVPAEQLTAYAGVYELAPTFKITVSTREGRLFAQATDQQEFEIFREKEDLFFLKVVEAKIQFNRDTSGKVESMTLFQNGQEVPGKKIN